MNELNYASLEASQRLYEAGIVLETDALWSLFLDGFHLIMNTELHPLVENYPAPSIAEVWMELPLKDEPDSYAHLLFYSHGVSWVTNEDESFFPYKESEGNIVNALIELFIWLRKEKP